MFMSVCKREREKESVCLYESGIKSVCERTEREKVPLRERHRDCVVIDLLESSCFIFLS